MINYGFLNHMLKRAKKTILIIWASPYSAIGILVGCLGVALGGRMRFREGAIECYAGLAAILVRNLPTGKHTAGFTLGHVILGQNAAGLDSVCDHERVHVRQFERWGPLMGPAYLLASAWMWLAGKDAYRDNPFEVEAFAVPTRTYNKPDAE